MGIEDGYAGPGMSADIRGQAVQLYDNGGRRSGIERRCFSYSGVIPERRTGEDRRSGSDRRCCADRRNTEDRRNGSLPILDERRSQSDRRSGDDRRDLTLFFKQTAGMY